MSPQPDVIVVGSGVGGGTVSRRLAERGLTVLMIERGGYLPREDDNWSPRKVFIDKKYTAHDTWFDRDGKPFRPALYYNVGGASKFFGCTMIRLRERDFEEVMHCEGVSPAWPVRYVDLAPYYDQAERLFTTHGTAGADPTEPKRAGAYPHSALANETQLQHVVDRLAGQGLRPFPQPMALRLPPEGTCIRCATCDGFPCKIDAKGDAEMSVVEPALGTGKVSLMTHTRALRLLLSPDGKHVSGLEVRTPDQGVIVLRANTYVLSAGAVNSAALLLASSCDAAPGGVANASGAVGRYYMAHNNTAMMALSMARNPTVFQKSVAITDFYFGDADFPHPMGCIMSLGKLQAGMLTAANRWTPTAVNAWLTARSYDWWIMSEDLPDPDNRVTLDGGTVKLSVTRNNLRAHRALVKRARRAMRRAGLPLTLSQFISIASPSHQCGTVRFGHDPATTSLDPYCRAHDHRNLFVIDASFFPSSAAVNPALTIAAQALRAADHMAATDFSVAS